MIATPTLHPHGTYRPETIKAATRAPKALWPAKQEQIVTASLFGGKPRLKIAQVSRIFLHAPKPYMLWLPESSE